MVLFVYTTPNAKKDKFIKSRGVYVALNVNNRKKVVAQRRRYVCVYKHIAEANAAFCGRGGATERVTDFCFKNRNEAKYVPTI